MLNYGVCLKHKGHVQQELVDVFQSQSGPSQTVLQLPLLDKRLHISKRWPSHNCLNNWSHHLGSRHAATLEHGATAKNWPVINTDGHFQYFYLIYIIVLVHIRAKNNAPSCDAFVWQVQNKTSHSEVLIQDCFYRLTQVSFLFNVCNFLWHLLVKF